MTRTDAALLKVHCANTTSERTRLWSNDCVKVCVVDGASGLCLGCWRTLSEIGGWSGFTDEQRARIMAELPARAGGSGLRA